MENENKDKKFTDDEINEATGKILPELFFRFSCMCNECAKKDVCKMIDEPPKKCEHFLISGNYKRYGNLNDLFQPIFEWLKFHYPSNEVKFFVDNTRAMMLIEHMGSAYSKEINLNTSFNDDKKE